MRTIHVIERELRRECSEWLKLPIQGINQDKVKDLIRTIVDDRGKPTQAHAIFALIRGFFAWCVETGDYGLEVSPFERPIKLKATVLIGKRSRRKRTLKDHEIEAYWRSCQKLGYPFGTAFQLLLLAALRLNEVAQAEWPEIDGEAGLWIIPAERMKGEEDEALPHAVPLVPDIAMLFGTLPRFEREETDKDKSEFIFSTTNGRRPVRGFSKAKTQLDDLMRRDDCFIAQQFAAQQATVEDSSVLQANAAQPEMDRSKSQPAILLRSSAARASDAVRPGDSMPNKFHKPSTPWSLGPWMTKSAAGSLGPEIFGRMPA